MLDYKSDQKQYNQKEYCASPIQIFNRKKGDCEDFAILKDGVLDYLAVPLDRRYLLAVDITDTIKFEGPSGHGILAIDMSPKNDLSDIYILDEYSFGDITPLKNTSYTPFSIMNRKKSLRVK